MTNDTIKLISMKQSAIDFNCEVNDFLSEKNKVVISRLNDGRKRNITLDDLFCHFISYGNSCVASVDEKVKDFIEDFIYKYKGFRCFEQFCILNEEFSKYNKRMGKGECFLPDVTKLKLVNLDFDVKIYVDDEVCQFYNDKSYTNALGYEFDDGRRDVIAVAGYNKAGKIMGLAGASNDSDTMWQVGIDVLPEFRNRGIATILVSIITDEILKKGIIPFYTTSWSNIASKNVAISSGYKSAWVQLSWVDKD